MCAAAKHWLGDATSLSKTRVLFLKVPVLTEGSSKMRLQVSQQPMEQHSSSQIITAGSVVGSTPPRPCSDIYHVRHSLEENHVFFLLERQQQPKFTPSIILSCGHGQAGACRGCLFLCWFRSSMLEFCYASAEVRIDAHLVCEGNHRPLRVRRPQQCCIVSHEESKVLCTVIELVRGLSIHLKARNAESGGTSSLTWCCFVEGVCLTAPCLPSRVPCDSALLAVSLHSRRP